MRLFNIVAVILFAPIVLTTNDLTPTVQTNSDKPSPQNTEPSEAPTAPSPAPVVEPVGQSEAIVQVAPGDTLIKIANRHQTTYPRIFNANPSIEHPDVIRPGDQVRIPRPDEQLAERPLPSAVPPSATASSDTAQPQRISRPKPKPVYTAVSSGSVWDRLAQCESGGNWSYNGPSGYDGGLQFLPSTWSAYNSSYAYAWQAPREIQIATAEKLLARAGWGQWPACAAKLGLL